MKNIQLFGLDYNQMTEVQQYELGTYVNLMLSSTQLLTNPIMWLQPKYAEYDFEKFAVWKDKKTEQIIFDKN